MRLGHTLFTHRYVVNNDLPDVAPHCELCNNASLSVKHMMECEQLMDARQACSQYFLGGPHLNEHSGGLGGNAGQMYYYY